MTMRCLPPERLALGGCIVEFCVIYRANDDLPPLIAARRAFAVQNCDIEDVQSTSEGQLVKSIPISEFQMLGMPRARIGVRKLEMYSRNSLILVSTVLSVACAQAESVGGIPTSSSRGGNSSTSSSALGGSDASSLGGQDSSTGGRTSSSSGGTSSRTMTSRDVVGTSGNAGDSGGLDTAGAAGKGGATSTRSSASAAAGRSGGGGAAQAAGAPGVAGATGLSSCLESAATECSSYCTGLNPGEKDYCDEVIKCWIENNCDSTKACSRDNGLCSMNTQAHGAAPWNEAVATAARCCP
jgi:hypothetical protein